MRESRVHKQILRRVRPERSYKIYIGKTLGDRPQQHGFFPQPPSCHCLPDGGPQHDMRDRIHELIFPCYSYSSFTPRTVAASCCSRSKTITSFFPFLSQEAGQYKRCWGPTFQYLPKLFPFTPI